MYHQSNQIKADTLLSDNRGVQESANWSPHLGMPGKQVSWLGLDWLPVQQQAIKNN